MFSVHKECRQEVLHKEQGRNITVCENTALKEMTTMQRKCILDFQTEMI